MADALRAISYIRVSTARDEMVSPEIQRAANEQYAAARGYRITHEIQDLDLSGRLWKRRQVERAVAMLESGQADLILVWKWSRLARNRLDWALALDRVERAGGKLESSTEPVDTSTSTGRFTRGMLAEMAAFESDRIGDVWKDVQRRRTAAGMPANGRPRFGYQVIDGRFEPDPETGPLLADIYGCYVAGESLYRIAARLNDAGHRVNGYTATPGLWTDRTLRGILDSGFGAGLIKVHGEHLPGSHLPVIDTETWDAYLAARERRRTVRRAENTEYLLTGLLRCCVTLDTGPCGASMSGAKTGRGRYYRCYRSTWGSHPSGYVLAQRAEAVVTDWLQVQAADIDAKVVSLAARRGRRRVEHRAADLDDRVAKLGRQLVELTRRLVAGVVPEDAYVTARDEIVAERDRLQAVIRQQQSDAASPLPDLPRVMRDWPRLDVGVQRELLRRLLKRVDVYPSRPRSLVVPVPVWDD